MRDGIGPVKAKQIKSHLVGFFVLGLAMGICEDLLAIHFATDAEITPRVVVIATIIAIPFAVISEILVDFKVLRQYAKAKTHNYLNSHHLNSHQKPGQKKQKSPNHLSGKHQGINSSSGSKAGLKK